MEWMVPTIFIIVILGFLGVCLYGMVMPKFMVKHARKVDARVITCEENTISGEDGSYSCYYTVQVDFYGLNGETIIKTFKSEKKYEEGEVIRSRYLDKKDIFLQNADQDVKTGSNKGLWLAIGVLILMLALVLFAFFGTDENGELPDWFSTGFGYFVSILFMGIGILGIYNKIRVAATKNTMQVIPGVQADYTISHGDGDDPDCYYPVYEYEWMGETHRYYSKTGGNMKKYRSIGRKVHMLRNPEDGRIICKEDENATSGFLMIFGLFGLVVFVCMLGSSLGWFPMGSSESGSESAGQEETKRESDAETGGTPALELYYMYEEGTEKCSFVIYIYDDASGKVLLFPTTAKEGRGINQQILFSLSISDMLKIGKWLDTVDLEALSMATAREGADVELTLYLYNSDTDEKYGGRGYLDDDIYGSLYELLQEVVPQKVWKEMQEREDNYYR